MKYETIERGWLTISQAAKYAGCRESSIRKAATSGVLPSYKNPEFSGSKRAKRVIHKNDVDAWIRTTWEDGSAA